MSTNLQWLLITIGLGLCCALVFFILRQHRLIKTGGKERTRRQAEVERYRAQSIQSIRVLAMTIEQDQIELSEACIRINALLQHIEPALLEQPPYSVFRLMAEETAHMPTHEKRQETDQRFIRRLDQQRFALERKHRDTIREAATAIRRYPFLQDASKAS